ncbi:MAG: hypothetical protein LBH44_02540 [Treponema sp.]|jgi:hypothetical protein|nr:hypothetical protein [Treponema sp.]
MKKIIIALFILALALPVFAQKISEENSSDVYYVNLTLEKVYPSKDGYVLQYRRGVNGIGYIGIPNEWFTDAASKAELIALPRGKNWPTVTVFYKHGEFSHIRLYVHKSKAHPTWGNVPQGADVSRHFKDAENFKLEF